MKHKRFKRIFVKVVFVLVLIQAPLLVMLNAGVHSTLGSVGYIFYFPALLLVQHMPTSPTHPWQNNPVILETVLVLMQTLMLSILLIPILALIQHLSGQTNRNAD